MWYNSLQWYVTYYLKKYLPLLDNKSTNSKVTGILYQSTIVLKVSVNAEK